jgi:hypothetical protein
MQKIHWVLPKMSITSPSWGKGPRVGAGDSFLITGWGRSRLAGLKLLSSGERGHGVESMYLPGGNVLRASVFGEVAEELLRSHPFFELVLNSRLGIFCPHHL